MNILTNQWSGKWRARLIMYEIGLVLAFDCVPAGLFLNNSGTPHNEEGQGEFAGCTLRAADVEGHYGGSPVYGNIGE